MSRNSLLQILALVCLALGSIFWGGARLLPLSLMAICIAMAGMFLLGTRPRLPGFLYVGAIVVALWSGACFLLSHNGIFGWKVFTMHVLYLGCFFIGARIAQEDEDRGTFFLMLACVVALGAVLYGYYRLDTEEEKILGLVQPLEYIGRMSGTFVSPNHFAVFAGMLGLLLLGFAIRARGLVSRSLLEAACFLAFLGVVLSGSRSALVILLFALGFFVFGSASPISKPVKIFLFLAGSTILILSLALHIGALQRLVSGRWDPGIVARVKVWQDSLSLVRHKPWMGYGLGNFQWYYPQYRSVGIVRKVDFAHSDVLQTWAEEGLVGLILWGIFFAMCWRQGRHQQDAIGKAMSAALLFLLITAVVDFPLDVPANGVFFFLVLGVWVGRGATPDVVLPSRTMRWVLAIALVFFLIGQVKTAVGEIYALQGLQARSKLEWDQALHKWGVASRWNPGNAVVWKWMGELSYNKYLFSRKTNQEVAHASEKFFCRSLQINPRDGAVWSTLGLLRMQQGKDQEAEACFRQALRLDPNNGFYHDTMARYLLAQGKRIAAQAHLENALWLYPRDGVAQNLLKKVHRQKSLPRA